MNKELRARLNTILEKVTSQEFLESRGLGNEIGFWIFDYNPEDEMQVREHISFLTDTLAKKHPHLKIVHINLLQTLKDYLDSRNFTGKAIAMQKARGNQQLLKALSGPLHIEKFAPFMVEHHNADEQDIVLITGIGSVWPLLRAHDLLNKLHALLGHRPLVMFYPGQYSGQSMSLFGRITSNNYYRAFKLAP